MMSQDRGRSFDGAARLIADSLLMRSIDRLVSACERLAGASLTASLLRRARITQIGVAVTSAYVTHVVLLQWMPDRLAPVKPLAYGVALAFAAFVALVCRMTMPSSATASAESSAGTAKTMKSSCVE